MADACQAQQRNLYREDVTSYRDGAGTLYMDQLHKVSWSIPTDVPYHAQFSRQPMIKQGDYMTMHPMEFMSKGDWKADSFANTYGSFGIRSDVRRAPRARARLASDRREPSRDARCAGTDLTGLRLPRLCVCYCVCYCVWRIRRVIPWLRFTTACTRRPAALLALGLVSRRPRYGGVEWGCGGATPHALAPSPQSLPCVAKNNRATHSTPYNPNFLRRPPPASLLVCSQLVCGSLCLLPVVSRFLGIRRSRRATTPSATDGSMRPSRCSASASSKSELHATPPPRCAFHNCWAHRPWFLSATPVGGRNHTR